MAKKKLTHGAKGKKLGQQFEADFKSSVPDYMDLRRFHDTNRSFMGKDICPKCKTPQPAKFSFQPTNIADYMIFLTPNLFYFELKSYSGKSLPFSAIVKENKKGRIDRKQLDMMLEASTKKGVFAGIIMNFRTIEATYYLSIDIFYEFYTRSESKSIPLKIFEKYGTLINQEKKIVNTRYDIEGLLKELMHA